MTTKKPDIALKTKSKLMPVDESAVSKPKFKRKSKPKPKKIPTPKQTTTERASTTTDAVSKSRAEISKIKQEAGIDPTPFKIMETKDPVVRAEKAQEKMSQIKILMAEWCVDYPRMSADQFLKEKGLDAKQVEEIFSLVGPQKWRDKQSQFTDEVVTRLTVRGIDRVALEYDKDLKAAQSAKADILKRIEDGETEVVERDPDGKIVKHYLRKATASEMSQLCRSYETLQKITDRSLGITDNNREAILENIKSREREVKEKSDKEVKEIKKLSYDDTKDLIALYREQKKSKEAEDDGEIPK
jgi:hypothetical protein